MKKRNKALLILVGITLFFTGAVGQAGADSEGVPEIVLEDGKSLSVNAIDQERGQDQLAIYTRNYGETTPPFSEDTVEYIVADGVVVVKNQNGTKGTFIPTTGYVLSASGTSTAALGDLDVGDVLQTRNIEIPVLPSKYFTVNGITVGIDKVDASRGANEVILYQPSYGSSTGQNPWGMELTVVQDKVTRVTAITYDPGTGQYLNNDSPIPTDGYVLSIQAGSPFYNQLNGKVAVGDSVELVTNSLIYSAGKITYDAFNPKVKEDNPAGWDDAAGGPFPGFRGADQLIVYDRNYGTHTGTNPWGFEAVVNDKGFIISNGGNDSLIPEGGYVLSGHGVKNEWLTKNALVGAKVRFDHANKQVLIIFTPESYLDKADISIANAEKALQDSKSKFMDVPYEQIEQKIAAAKTLNERAKAELSGGVTNGLFELLNELDQYISDTYFMNFESRKVDNRGLWLRPKEKNIEQVREHLKRMKETNINSLYLESMWDGYTIFPIDNPYTKLNPIYEGFDVLKAYLEEGEKLGIEIHAWVENFAFGTGGPVVEKRPEWLMVNRKGNNFELDDYGTKWYWLNPALPEARDFVSSIYKELLTRYDVASLHLDYARYPGSGDYTNDFGYDTYTRGLFIKKAGVDPIDLHPGDDHWDEWLQFRADFINTWIERVVAESHVIRDGLQITAAVWPNYDEAPKTHAQETKYWVEHNLIDNLFHMSYVPDAVVVVQDLKNSLLLAQGKSFVTSGVGTFINLTKTELVRQINAAVMAGGDGSALFEFESLFGNGYDRELKLGVYRNEAVMPDYRTTLPLSVMVEDMVRKIDNIYVPFQGMSANDAKGLEQDLNSVLNVLKPHREYNHGIATAAKQKLESLQKDTSESMTIQAEVKNRLTFDLAFSVRLLDLYFAKEQRK
ncbi:glycoside hydrolase family 10 protein [Paenibacillus beijingensis]|uniref:glycoside hydrolase family 10 protein n=1 Tax=Paenibacillus beijingensis TaxID=1126833 RepID=UPI000697D582|nr:family 10 glycosylhydrolase [Paenibacillus beijingensis]